MKVCAIAQARMGSTRFPGKVMADLGGKPVLSWVVEALRQSPGVDNVVIATSTLDADNIIVEWCITNEVDYYRGSESDVLDRFYQCAQQQNANIVLRLTCDCPYLDPNVVGQVIQLRKITGASYCTNQPTWPDGLDVECFTFEALKTSWLEATRQTDRDCVTQYMFRNADRFPAAHLICPFPGAHKERWVLDTKDDYELCKAIARRWNKKQPPTCTDIMRILDAEPTLRDINKHAIRNERFYEGLAEEQLPTRTYTRSNELLVRATKTIPFGSQTFSKSHLFYPENAAPLYISHGDGARVFDVDGNDYIDLVNALLPVVLGYRDPDVDEAVRRQLSAGMSFSLATKLEAELSEKLCGLIPCAEMVKFGKSGTDVTTAAVRLARAYTGKDQIMVGGYHGWADWSMAHTDKNNGIPELVQRQSLKIKYGDRKGLEWWRANSSGIAAVVVEPTHNVEYLQRLRQFCTTNQIILIFDEIQTGFRYSLGGAQKYFGVTPDLACFGKSMGNGMPISALVGKREIMNLFNQSVFYSGTFFGDTLSLAAALATIKKMEDEHVIEHLFDVGGRLRDWIQAYNGPIKFQGYAPLVKLVFEDYPNITKEQSQGLLTQEMAKMGVLLLNANGVSFSIKEPELKQIIRAYEHSFRVIDGVINGHTKIEDVLHGSIKAKPLRQTA